MVASAGFNRAAAMDSQYIAALAVGRHGAAALPTNANPVWADAKTTKKALGVGMLHQMSDAG
jgi:hypothetical protein